MRNALYDRKVLPVRRLPQPVVSVGNLSTGGSGKTPMVLALAALLAEAGREPIVLSRGYGRRASAVQRVEAGGTAEQFGDEPLLLARKGIEVWVGNDRFAAGTAALVAHSKHNDIVFLLDDGMQHRRLARALNIAMIAAQDMNDALLPSGNLREPLSTLARADIVAMTEDDAEHFAELRKRFVGPSCTRPALWTYVPQVETAALAPARVFAFCGIARPERFISALGPEHLVGQRIFADHHRYTDGDVATLARECRSTGATAFATTEKDLVRLTPQQRDGLNSAAPLHAPPLRLQLSEPNLYLQQMLAMFGDSVAF